MNWLIIMLIAILVLIIFKKEIEHKTTKIVVVLLVFFVITLIFSYSTIRQQNIDLKSWEGFKTAGGIYLSWLGNAFGNARVITANAIKMEWTPNTTNSTFKPALKTSK
jgi:hypothetical protein